MRDYILLIIVCSCVFFIQNVIEAVRNKTSYNWFNRRLRLKKLVSVGFFKTVFEETFDRIITPPLEKPGVNTLFSTNSVTCNLFLLHVDSRWLSGIQCRIISSLDVMRNYWLIGILKFCLSSKTAAPFFEKDVINLVFTKSFLKK